MKLSGFTQEIKDQFTFHEETHNGLHGVIKLNIDSNLGLISTLNNLINYKFEILEVTNNYIKVICTDKTNTEFLNSNNVNLEKLNVNWEVKNKYSNFDIFLKNFKRLNTDSIYSWNISHSFKDLKFEVELPDQKIITRQGHVYYNYKSEILHLLQQRNIYTIIFLLNNMIFERIEIFSGCTFRIHSFTKTSMGYKIEEIEDLPF